MSAIVNVNFSAIAPQILQNQPVESLPKEHSGNQQKQKEIADIAYLSKVSKSLNQEKHANSQQFLENGSSGNIESVRSFILSHKSDAIEQQANQSKSSSLALIS